jgi:hypothetical protein
MTLAEYKSIAKVGDRVCIKGFNQTVLALNTRSDNGPRWGIITDGPQWMQETFNGNPCGVWDFSEPYKITLLSDTPDWRLGLAPIPREELRVGMRIKDGLNGTPYTITKIFDGLAYNNEGFNPHFTDSSRARVDLYLVPSPDTEWLPLSSENIAKYLSVGDTIEMKWKEQVFGPFMINKIENGMIYLYYGIGSCSSPFNDENDFRLIKKATPEVAREEPLPHVYTREEYAKIARVGDRVVRIYSGTEFSATDRIDNERDIALVRGCCCEEFKLLSRGPEGPADRKSESRTLTKEEFDSYLDEVLDEVHREFFSPSSNITKPNGHNKLMQVVTNLMKTVANSLLKDEDKAMRAKGFQDDKGEDTQMFIEEVQARRLKADCDEFRAAITADVVKVWKEEQEKK